MSTESPTPALGVKTRRPRPSILVELAVTVFLVVVYDQLANLANVHPSVALHNGANILDLEQALHIGIEDNLNRWFSSHGILRSLSADYYEFLHVSVAITVLVICYVRRPDFYRVARNSLVLINIVGFAVYALYPVAPPRLLPGNVFMDTVAQAGFGSSHGGPIPINQYAAMPSLHLGWATWVALVGFALTRKVWLRCLLVLHPILTTLVVMGTANHYLLDAVFGTLLSFAAVSVALAWDRRTTKTDVSVVPSPRVEASVPAG